MTTTANGMFGRGVPMMVEGKFLDVSGACCEVRWGLLFSVGYGH